ncbi:unnamed protein product [Lactuca saligna]|uniref:Uncharacterized protein n=1 Tax=Lactuca saligna TaxID=75948 RepID=A0AA36EK90_LACSI|nr:unnamed protein product [Lactuca saligna]
MVIFFSIKVHFQGVFINKHFCYSDGVHHVFENIDFVEFPVYIDHFGTTVHITKENENKDNYSVKSNMSSEGEEGIDLTNFISPQQSNMEGLTYEGVSQANGNEDSTEGYSKDDEDENVPDLKVKQCLMKTYLGRSCCQF